MDRFQEETYNYSAAAAHAAKVWGDNPICAEAGAVNICQNCYQSCETLTYVPEGDFMACPTCYDEAMVEAAKDAAYVAVKPAKVQRMQAEFNFLEVA